MNKPIIIISGPTASGKTDIASHLCQIIGGEIISADSRQVYRLLDTGTNKSGDYDAKKHIRVTLDGIPQHLTDIIDPGESFSAGDFIRQANALIIDIRSRSKIPVIAGGAGLYIKALVNGLVPLPTKDDNVRSFLRKDLETGGTVRLYEKLKAVDPSGAEKNRYNPQRLIRALEVYELTGKSLSALHICTVKPEFNFIQFAPEWKREELYYNINKRTGDMLANGMIEETKTVLARGYPENCQGLGSLGYRHVIGYLNGKLTLGEAQNLISLDTRHYAKRQMTWFRGIKELRWIKISGKTYNSSEIADIILKESKI